MANLGRTEGFDSDANPGLPGELQSVFGEEEMSLRCLLDHIEEAITESRNRLDEAEQTTEQLYGWIE